MRLVFMGTPHFAVPSLEVLAKAHDVVAVVTATDKPAGRGQKLLQSPVKDAALKLNIPVLQPEKLRNEGFLEALAEANADLFVVVAFRMLPEQVWTMPPRGTINLHASLLPQYRGAAPINRAIMNGETSTGLTTFFIEQEIDTGKIIASVPLDIGEDETAGSLHDRMMVAGASLLLHTVNLIESNTASTSAQRQIIDGSTIKAAHKIFKEDCRIDWRKRSAEIHNHIRGLSPFPGAFTEALSEQGASEYFKVSRSKRNLEPTSVAPGTVRISDGKLLVAAADNWVEITEIQAPGKRRIDAASFINGWRMPKGFSFLP